MERSDTGILLSAQNIKLHRQWFIQMTKLIGIKVGYRAPVDGTQSTSSKNYNLYGELDPDYMPETEEWCIYDEHPSQKTMRKLGWNTEMNDTSTLIHVRYDLEGLQAGAMFTIPAGIDSAQPRKFRVLRMSNIAIYPASIACELGPLLENELVDQRELIDDFDDSTFNLLGGESEKYGH